MCGDKNCTKPALLIAEEVKPMKREGKGDCRIMLDASPSRIKEYSKKMGYEFWQLRTPLTEYALAGIPYGLDNGCFKEFRRSAWERLLKEAESKPPVFACLPDIVGDARRTLDLFDAFAMQTNGLPRALVLQDGIGQHSIPWSLIEAVFVGGTDQFKISAEAMNVCVTAKMLGKWIHVGRVNGIDRLNYWRGIADSIDGTALSKFDTRAEVLVASLQGVPLQSEMLHNERRG